MSYRVVIASNVLADEVSAEIWDGDDLIGDVRRGRDGFEFTVASIPGAPHRVLSVDLVRAALDEAIRRLPD
jgi:hypothetical protein